MNECIGCMMNSSCRGLLDTPHLGFGVSVLGKGERRVSFSLCPVKHHLGSLLIAVDIRRIQVEPDSGEDDAEAAGS